MRSAERCPSARFDSVALFPDHDLEFTWFSRRNQCGSSDVVSKREQSVWGVLYEIDEKDRPKLDAVEGVNSKAYKPISITVFRGGDSLQPISAFTYTVRKKLDEHPKPSRAYKDHIVSGAIERSLPADYIAKLKTVETIPLLTQNEFDHATRDFDEHEQMRGQLYYNALDLIQHGFEVEAHLLILATWNFARFRYATRTFDLREYERALKKVAEQLKPVDGMEFRDLDLSIHRRDIADSFSLLAAIEGVELTGATKILHVLTPKSFVMWDRFISGQYPKKHYASLDVVQRGFWLIQKFRTTGDGYCDVLRCCQIRFAHLKSPDRRKTLAQCIDEFNFVKITLPVAKAVNAKKMTMSEFEEHER